MVYFVLGTKSIIVTPMEVHLAEHVVPIEWSTAHPRVRLVFNFYQYWKRKYNSNVTITMLSFKYIKIHKYNILFENIRNIIWIIHFEHNIFMIYFQLIQTICCKGISWILVYQRRRDKTLFLVKYTYRYCKSSNQ